jgi:integrase-like protein
MTRHPKLLDRYRAALRVRHYSVRTEESYVAWVRRFILHHGKKHPAAMGSDEVNAFLSSLAIDGHVSASTQNQALAAILSYIGSYWKIPFHGWVSWPGRASLCECLSF